MAMCTPVHPERRRVRRFVSALLLIAAWIPSASTAVAQPAPPPPASPESGGFFPGKASRPTFLYGVDAKGQLTWFRQDDSDTGAFIGPARPVGRGWGDATAVFAGGGDVIYTVTPAGTLRWFRHNGYYTGGGLEQPDNWKGGNDVGRGWAGVGDIVPGGDGVIYVIEPDGTLRWHRHLHFLSGHGLETPGAWAPSRPVGRGWTNYRQVFSGGDGILYVIAKDGTLNWYRHKGYLTGAGLETPGAWEGPKPVGRGWGDVTHAFSAGDGVIYAVMADGTVRWFRHVGYERGLHVDTPGAWEGPRPVGRGWGELKHVFALLPRQPDPLR
jgi:hypothetical protein